MLLHKVWRSDLHVLILILVEDTLWDFSRNAYQAMDKVLILILMEDTLWVSMNGYKPSYLSLNPYSNGRYSMGVFDTEANKYLK